VLNSEALAPSAGTVLVVDDDENVRQSLIDVMATAGIKGVGAAGRAEALAAQLRSEPSVVVVDYRLPDCSGIDLARELKEHDPEVPVLLLTGYASLDTAVAAVGQLDAYLIKPVAPHLFLQTIRNALARRGLVDENRSLVERLQRLNAYQALYDPLTGLPNRALLDDRLSQALAAARRTGSSLAVLFVDLDRFKLVNDLFGHHVGDQLLREMADRLATARRRSDTVARFGGDEFVVVCPDVGTSASACRIAEHLLNELARPATVEGVEHRLTASIGITLTGPGAVSQSPETLLRNADTAMYRAKEGGRADWELFDETMRDRVVERFEVERGLRAGMESGDLVLAYQPIVDLASGAVVGAEALMRWHRAGHGTILPVAFLPVAEESGLIAPIGRWVFDSALSELSAWERAGLVPREFRLWINVSPHQLADPAFAQEVGDMLMRYDVPSSMLGVEVVEDALRDVGATTKVLRELRELGVSVNLDDFGAGYSNLSWLQELPITGIKIDRRFVATLDVAGEVRGAAIVQGLISLGHALGLLVVAEGIETPAQAVELTAMGCELGQGYHFAYPGSSRQLWAMSADNPTAAPSDGVAHAGDSDESAGPMSGLSVSGDR
jgi:diguanylate cyclase (GGDEF)-like protein